MDNIISFIQSNISSELHPFVVMIALGIVWIVIYDFYHLLFSSILSWFKK